MSGAPGVMMVATIAAIAVNEYASAHFLCRKARRAILLAENAVGDLVDRAPDARRAVRFVPVAPPASGSIPAYDLLQHFDLLRSDMRGRTISLPTAAGKPARPRPDACGDALPIGRDDERALPDARRQVPGRA
jgi:hypothetical protein